MNPATSAGPIDTVQIGARRRPLLLFLLTGMLGLGLSALAPAPATAALLDVWRADSLGLNDGDFVETWASASNRTANSVSGITTPVLRRNVTPAGGAAVRFNQNRLGVVSSPVGGRTAFSVAYVFRADAVGANGAANNWYGKTGIVDAEQGGVTADWGTVITETGNVGIGIGNGDTSLYSTGPSLVDSSYHAAVFTWGGGLQAVYVDARTPVSAASPSAARNSAGFSFGGIHTDEAGAARRFVGDLVEVRFYDTALTALQASNVIQELRDLHIFGNLPRIRSFVASTNFIYLGGSATLSWEVTNAANVSIDQGLGNRPAIGNVTVNPTLTTTYSMIATNTNGLRMASVTIVVDPGVPTAFNFSTNVGQGSSVPITLRGSDPNGGVLTYSIVAPPGNGSLSGPPPNVNYTPAPGFFGFDNFTFKVNDGAFDSAPATVTIKVVPPPMPPTGVVLSSTHLSAGTGPGAFLATIRAIDPNEFDTHTFALVAGGGSADNGRFVVNGSQLLAGPTYAGGVGATFNIRLRATDNTAFAVEQSIELTVVSAPPPVVINEVHYNSPQNTVHEEFIELHNSSGAPIDLSNWRLRGGVDYFLPLGTTIPAGGFLVVAEDPATMQSRYGVTALGPWAGGLNKDGEELTLRNAVGDEADHVDFRSEFPWPIASNGDGPSMQLIHPAMDNDLGSSWRAALPSPGATNRVYAANAAPNIRQVEHAPHTPTSSQPIVITAKVTDPNGVATVALAYQVVTPGAYIPAFLPLTTAQLNNVGATFQTNALNAAFEASTNWTTVSMRDDGSNGDALAGDDIYSATIPAQANRGLVRYRITCGDTLGAARRAPFEDDPSLNFACFVYDGIPAYLNFSAESLKTLPVFTLLTRDAELQQCAAWVNVGDQLPQGGVGVGGRNEGRLHYNWEGTMVYDGEVYDHVRYRLRGANGRYHPGKRSFRIRFNEGRLLDAKDQNGERFPTKWRELTTGKGQGNRGSVTFALNEVVNYFLWNKVGVPAPATLHFHFRVVRGAQESPADRYAGDFWGLNWGQEKYDVNFLDAHDLPRGNLYKLVDNYVLGVEERRYQGPYAVTNAQDFSNLENNLDGNKTTDYLLAHANYTNWYRYFTVAEAIRHYDTWPSANKNGAWYFEPVYGASNSFLGRAMQLPYDSTDTWGPTWNNGEDILFNGIFPSSATGGDQGQNPGLQIQYRNVVRELRDLLFQPDQMVAIIDAHAAPLAPLAAADFARWRSNSIGAASYVQVGTAGSQSPGPANSQGFPAYVQDLKNFMFVGGNYTWWLDRNSVGAGGWITRLDAIAGADTSVPNRPVITYIGAAGFPIDGLLLESSDFADPQGAGTFGAMQWRVAEVLPTNEVVTSVAQLRLELDAAWDSGELTTFGPTMSVPARLLIPEHLYRARVRHQDNTGRWSRWSAPVEFRPGAADLFTALKRDLVISEIMYNPPADGPVDGDEFEFIELRNLGTGTLELTGLAFSAGVNYSFPNGTRLAPGAIYLLARNPAMLATRYPGVVVNGAYSGRLDNAGELVAIAHPVGGVIVEVTYGERGPWPVAADGFGYSLVLVDAATGTYRASASPLGSPGANGAASTIGGVVINEVLSGSTDPLRDTIELFNTTGASVDIGGWYLTDDPTYPWKYGIPPGTTLGAGAYLLVDETQFNAVPGQGSSFSLSSLGDDVYLFSSAAPGTLSGYSHGFRFGAARDGVSFGRYVNSVGEEQFPAQTSRTFGAVNAGPRFGPVVISEIHYHPHAGVAADEFVELRNLSAAFVNLFDTANPTNRWRVGGLGFEFPAATTIPPNGSLLLVADDPVAFRARFGVAANVSVLRFSGNLQDSGENLELQAPDLPTTNGVPYFVVDAVRYNDRNPWPLAADGAGASLQRINPSAYGDDPINWLAAAPTPGGSGVSGIAPGISIQPISTLGVLGGPASFSVAVRGTDPLRYQWRVNGSNLEDATNATLIIPSVQFDDAGTYQVVAFNSGGSVESSNVTLVVRVGANIMRAPVDVQVRIPPDPQAAPTTNATFSVSALTFNPPLTYQWQVNGINIPGATGSSLTVSNVQAANEGAYRVIVTDGVGSVASGAGYLYPLVRPLIVESPITQSVVEGGLVGLSAVGTGSPFPFGWEWRRISTTVASNTVNDRVGYHSFLNTNAPGSSIQYRVVLRNLAGTDNKTLNVITLADTDHDGLPDEWETQYFGSATGGAANVDGDSDGLSNAQEYGAGTNPTNAASFLKVALSLTTNPLITFGAESNKTYTIQYSGPLGGAWLPLTNISARATSRTESIVDPLGAGNRFYRVVTPASP